MFRFLPIDSFYLHYIYVLRITWSWKAEHGLASLVLLERPAIERNTARLTAIAHDDTGE